MQQNNSLEDEMDFVFSSLDPGEIYILGFLRGANREELKMMSYDGLFII